MTKYNRILLKLSGEALAGDKGTGFNEDKVREVAAQVKVLLDKKIQVAIVIGGGNFWRGRSNPNMDRTKADQIGMLATVMNCLFVREVFRIEGIDGSVLTPFPVGTMTELFSKDLALEHMNQGKVVFYAGGTGHPYFSTDTGAVLRAIETDVDAILLAKNIDGVYSDDPRKNKDAVKYSEITFEEVIAQKLQVIDMTATIMCMENNMKLVVFHLNEDQSIVKAIDGKVNGTIVRL